MESYDIFELAQLLRQNQIFINSEKRTYSEQKSQLLENFNNNYKLAWILSQERQNLSDLIVARPHITPDLCSYRASQLHSSIFMDVYKIKTIKYQHICGLMKLLNFLQKSPYLLAQCLSIADRINQVIPSQNDKIVHVICDSFYGSLLNTKDIEMILSILQQLIQLQIVNHETPRRMLRPSSSSFARLYERLHSSLSSAKLFLLASLYEPIISVLIEEHKMECNPNDNTQDLASNYTNDTSEKLYVLTNRFVKSLSENWLLFPSPLSWLIQKVCFSFKQANFQEEETYMILVDMIFTNFIIPAIVSPFRFGIIDLQIDDVAQHNLMQIGQTLQKLALHKYQAVDTKMHKLYERFDKNAIPNLVQQLMPQDYGIFHQNLCASLFSAGQTNIQRDKLLISRTELNLLLDFLRIVIENDGSTINSKSKKELVTILEKLPIKIDEPICQELRHENNNIALESVIRSKQGLIALGKTSKPKINKHVTEEVISSDLNDSASSFINGNVTRTEELDEVLVFPISLDSDQTSLDLLPEAQVTGMNSNVDDVVAEDVKLTEKNVEVLSRCNVEEPITLSNGATNVLHNNREKNTRFSLSRDDGSIGNTSDNLEAQSEAPSNHSVTSSLDLEENDQNDNLSDMVSANVSGRGTPNISGRDTPSSQVTESGNNPMPPQMVKIMNKNRSDIEDKFCKFEIKKLLEGDETVSIISDTWSTDAVLASDSETIDANERNFATPLIPNNVILPGDYGLPDHLISNFRVVNFDETQSESNWSTDVLGSDTEKPSEVEYEVANKSLELPSPESIFYDSQSSVREQKTSNNFITADLLDLATNEKNLQFNESIKAEESKCKDESGLTNADMKTLEESSEVNIIRSDSNITNPFFNEDETLNEFSVQHRRNVTVQRNSNFDSRRNGVVNSESKPSDGLLLDFINNSKQDGTNSNGKTSRSSSGAIPKSISFDFTADKNDQYSPSKRGGIFNKIKGLANMKGRRNRFNVDQQHVNENQLTRNTENDEKAFLVETSDDILGKYRRKVSTSSDPASSESAGSNSSSSLKSKSSKSDIMKANCSEPDFENVRRKIKMVLSRSSVPSTDFKSNCRVSQSPMHTYLQIQMAEATETGSLKEISYTFEALRLLSSTNLLTQHKVYQHLQSELISGQRYIQYLTKCRQNLLLSIEMVEKINKKIASERELCIKNLIDCCVRMFLDKNEQINENFYDNMSKLFVADEKIELMKEFINAVLIKIRQDGILRGVLSVKELEIKDCIEKRIMQKVYKQLLFPNDDADKLRDNCLSDHIKKLSQIVTPTHKLIKIPKEYLNEAPWSYAQQQLLCITAGKTPKEKVKCIVRACHCIMSMLSMAIDNPSADDLTPVLIFIIIKANPPNLLSTIQYINCFIGDKLEGEENYWWTQFVTAVEFIKSMDY
ncbi:receptor-mediated endocytosis protein 6 homolog [Culicoides brevitarsis]|uniref:receptor-mediated endocytosis protein 6 homolog n=1 Tax=Culicoides brevitarsis TaxID=469753 RepID=UPI00307B45B7